MPRLAAGMRRAARSLGAGVAADASNRARVYKADWTDIGTCKLRVLAAATYIFFASAMPALAFGEQLSTDTQGQLTVVHVLAASALAGAVQAVAGGQPLLILGVSEPIVLVWGYMYSFAEDKEGLGRQRFLAWAAWACVWAAALLVILAVTNAAGYIARFTRFAGEAFSALIAVLFMQQAIRGAVNEFRRPPDAAILGSVGGTADAAAWRLVNGLWSLFLSFGLVLTALLARTARRWRFLRSPARALLADYGVPLLVVAWSGLSYAVAGPGGVPARVVTPNTWDVKGTWTVAKDMGSVPGSYIAGALVPGAIIAILFFFDHSVSSQLAQQPEFGVTKPPAYHYDLLLLGLLTLLCGLIGLPATNGVIPQSPMHTKALSEVVGRRRQLSGCTHQDDVAAADGSSAPAAQAAVAATQAPTDGGSCNGATVAEAGDGAPIAANGWAIEAATAAEAAPTPGGGIADGASRKLNASNSAGGVTNGAPVGGVAVVLSVCEQRGSGLLQSLALGACLATTPAIRCIPTAVLWGYFAFMAVESLPGSQLWDRTLLLLTDPKRRHLVLEHTHAPYLQTTPLRAIAAFTLLQLLAVGGIYGLTWAGVAGVLFPIPIMLLVPARQYLLPRLFSGAALEELDAGREEVAEALPSEAALAQARAQGLEPPEAAAGGGGAGGGGPQRFDSGEILDEEMARYRVVHHLTQDQLAQRRRSASLTSAGSEAATAAEAAAAAAAISATAAAARRGDGSNAV